MTVKGFQVGPRVAKNAITRAQEIAAFHKRFVGQFHDVVERDSQFFLGLLHKFALRSGLAVSLDGLFEQRKGVSPADSTV